MPDDVTLDSLAPASTQAPPAPAASPTPAAAPPSPSSPTPASSATPAGAAPPAPAAPAFDQGAWLKSLGYDSLDEYKADLAFSRRARSEFERAQQERLRSDPQHQQMRQRGEALRQLIAEGYSPEIADALPQLPEISNFLSAQRADAAGRDLDGALAELGLTFDDSAEAQAIRQSWEDAVADKLNSDVRLNARYFGTPAERKAVIREIVGHEERRINHVLLQQNAQTLRDAAQRAARTPRAGRAPATMPTAAPQRSAATDPTIRRRENAAHASRSLDDIYSWSH